MVSNRIKADARAHMARNPGTSYQASLRAVTATPPKNTAGLLSRVPTFLEALGIGDIATHDFTSAWRDTAQAREIRVPFGYRCQDGEVSPQLGYLALNDADEDHLDCGSIGVVAGRTGSGKSYLFRGLALSLAATYAPDRVSLVLANLAGGPTFRGLGRLPHVALSLTNLRDDAGNRVQFLSYIRDEAQRRKEMLDRTSPSLPHMVIIVDELGSGDWVISEVLAEIGRVGRPLGVHLVVSTQGIMPEIRELLDNANYYIAFRLSSEEVSREIIGTGEAASLTSVGAALYRRTADWAPTGVKTLTRSDPPAGGDAVGPSRETTQEDALIERLSSLAAHSLSE